jgi:DNA (cytosine-5)-methyltransferase 1
MPKQLLVRNIPPNVSEWIEDGRRQTNMSQREFVLSVLNNAYTAKREQLENGHTERIVPKSNKKNDFTFIDLFAGIGGFRIAFESLGGGCVFSSEWDKYAQKTYKAWFGEMPAGDIRKINPKNIPNHDILAAGFPCQPFSIAGVSKKKSLGRAHGFKDKNQGNLFFYLATIIKAKKPPVLFLENVKNLRSHDSGRTWKVIKSTLEEMNYVVFDKIHDAAHWVPQHRERVFIIGFHKKYFGNDVNFTFPEPPKKQQKLKDILEENPSNKYTLTEHLWEYLQNYAKRHQEKGNGFGFGMANPEGITRTLSARYYKDGSEILISQGNSTPPRRLTPVECSRLMGFPPECKIVVSDTQAYRQFGNAVVVPAIEAVAKKVVKVLTKKNATRAALTSHPRKTTNV